MHACNFFREVQQFSVDIVVWFLFLCFAVVLIVCAFFPGNLTAGFLLIELFGFFV